MVAGEPVRGPAEPAYVLAMALAAVGVEALLLLVGRFVLWAQSVNMDRLKGHEEAERIRHRDFRNFVIASSALVLIGMTCVGLALAL